MKNASADCVIIANQSHATRIAELRKISYCHSLAFSVIDVEKVREYCTWSGIDNKGLVLLALDSRGRAISTLRANVYFSFDELLQDNPVFENYDNGFIKFPVLDLTIAATHPDYFGNGLLSVLRYYAYLINKHAVKSISGVVVKNSSPYKTLSRFGYEFIEVDTVGEDVVPTENWMLARLDIEKIDIALNYLKDKYSDTINKYPLVIEADK